MDNIKYYNDCLAYDFSMFAPKPQDVSRNKDNIVVMPDRNKKYAKRKKAARKAVASPALLIMTAVIALTGLCGSIAMRLKINEVNTQIKDVKAQIAELDSEKTELEVEMQRRISFANLEVEATELGMKKPEKENVVYIRVNDKDAAKTADGTLMVSES